ncbi:MAG: type II toxin-antitoxin system Phd/YefM family antitoxin [Nitrosopumilaceae archaeon]|nr:type II toxin-antitoxin system Phd/YefM family antitoxin [Nitrosopumilaceae archaeon]
MAVKTYSSREFNQDTSGAKRAASGGPVFITDRGRPAHVLLTYEHFQRLTTSPKSIVDLLAMPGDLEFEAPKMGNLTKPADLS